MKINLKKVFNTIMLCLFILFISLYVASETGYYEYQNKEKKEFTEEKIKQFEEDVKKGKQINLKDYLNDNIKVYDNKVTKLGNTLSDIINYSVMDGLEKTFKAIEKLIE